MLNVVLIGCGGGGVRGGVRGGWDAVRGVGVRGRGGGRGGVWGGGGRTRPWHLYT